MEPHDHVVLQNQIWKSLVMKSGKSHRAFGHFSDFFSLLMICNIDFPTYEVPATVRILIAPMCPKTKTAQSRNLF